MDAQLQNALVSQDVKFIKKNLNPSKGLQPPVIDYGVLSDQLLEHEWSLRKVVDLGKTELTRLFLRAGNGSMNVDEGYLHEAVSNLDVDHVRLFLQEFNADANSFDEHLRTPIFYLDYLVLQRPSMDYDAVTDKEVKILKMLIERGANIVTPSDDYNDRQLLQVTHILMKGTSEAVSIILDMDVIDLKERYNYGSTVAHFLARNPNPNTFTLLRNKDFHVNSRNLSGHTLLWIAVASGVPEAVEFLLNNGADVNIRDGSNVTPLRIAMIVHNRAEEIHRECILLLLDHGVDVQAPILPNPYDPNYDEYDPPIAVFDEVSPNYRIDEFTSDDKSVQLRCEILIQHLALQAALGTTLTTLVQRTINSDPGLKEQLNIGRELLQSQIFGSHTLFSVLTCGEEKLVSLMRKEQLAEKLQSYLQSNSSIYYNHLLQKRLTKGGQIIKLRGKAAFVVGKLMEMDYNCQPVVVDIVLSYLDLEDLNTLMGL